MRSAGSVSPLGSSRNARYACGEGSRRPWHCKYGGDRRARRPDAGGPGGDAAGPALRRLQRAQPTEQRPLELGRACLVRLN